MESDDAAPSELVELRAELERARAQLRERNRLATLGELSAGVAHELRNPLHFVSNFSSTAVDVLGELRELLAEPAPSPARTEELLVHLDDALSSIEEHGARASRMVVTVLAQARQASGQRVHADLNQTLHDALRLSHYGHRAQHDLQVHMVERYDESLESFEFTRDDLSRAFLNMLENAHHAVQLRALNEGPEYRPEISVSTRDLGGTVEVRICDNGPGIPPEVAARVFEPFFTTKPASRGTGLGLSICREIVTRGAQGTLELDDTAGEGTVFVITIPKQLPAAHDSAGQ